MTAEERRQDALRRKSGWVVAGLTCLMLWPLLVVGEEPRTSLPEITRQPLPLPSHAAPKGTWVPLRTRVGDSVIRVYWGNTANRVVIGHEYEIEKVMK